MEYIFASDRIYPVDRSLDTHKHGGILVERDTLICYDVVGIGSNNFMGASTWQFKVHGHGDTLYRTHYAWALVENTPENVERLKAAREAQRKVVAAQWEAKQVANLVTHVSTPKG